MIKVLIISKTRMYNAVCVGAMLDDGRCIRLLAKDGSHFSNSSKVEVGEFWNLEYVAKAETKAPHVEDVLVSKAQFTGDRCEDLYAYIVKRAIIWTDPSDNLFEGCIRWTHSGSGFISVETGVPGQSVGFFLSKQPLTFRDDYYQFPVAEWFHAARKLKYVGVEPAVTIIPSGTLIRVSLARWWRPMDVNIEERCYGQLSGWYPNPK